MVCLGERWEMLENVRICYEIWTGAIQEQHNTGTECSAQSILGLHKQVCLTQQTSGRNFAALHTHPSYINGLLFFVKIVFSFNIMFFF